MDFFRTVDDIFQSKIATAKTRKKPQVRGDNISALAARLDNVRKSDSGLSGRDFERIIGRNDLMPVSYFERGTLAARAVGRIGALSSESMGDMSTFWGTCFRVSPNLILTNNHVIADLTTAGASIVEFNFQRDIHGTLTSTRRFRLNPDVAFLPHLWVSLTIA